MERTRLIKTNCFIALFSTILIFQTKSVKIACENINSTIIPNPFDCNDIELALTEMENLKDIDKNLTDLEKSYIIIKENLTTKTDKLANLTQVVESLTNEQQKLSLSVSISKGILVIIISTAFLCGALSVCIIQKIFQKKSDAGKSK